MRLLLIIFLLLFVLLLRKYYYFFNEICVEEIGFYKKNERKFYSTTILVRLFLKTRFIEKLV